MHRTMRGLQLLRACSGAQMLSVVLTRRAKKVGLNSSRNVNERTHRSGEGEEEPAYSDPRSELRLGRDKERENEL